MTQQINLYEARLRPRHELATAHNLGITAAALLVVMMALSLYAGYQADRKTVELSVLQAQVSSERERMTVLSKAVADRRVSPVLVNETEKTKALLVSRQEVMDVLDSGKVGNSSGFSEFMFGFSRQTQTDLWLTGFSMSAGGEEIEIRGRLLDPAKLPGYVQRLSAEPVFHGRRFAALDMRSVEPAASLPEGAAATPPPVPEAVLPRFIEFVLRSAHGGATTGAVPGARP